MKSFVVIGIGRFGTALVKSLYEMGHEVLAIDKDPDAIADIAEYTTEAIEVDVRDEAVFEELGLSNFDAAVVSMGEDLEASILATLLLKEMDVPLILAKAQSELHGKVLRKIGANKIVYPERDMGVRVAHNLVSPNIEDYISLSDNYGMLEINVPAKWQGKMLTEVNVRKNYDVTVVAIQRKGETIITPRPSEKMLSIDRLVIIGSNEALKHLEDMISNEE